MSSRILRVIVLAISVLAPLSLQADETPRLFELQPGRIADTAWIEAAWRVAIDTDLLLASPRLRLELPDGLEFEAARSRFERRGRGSGTWTGRLVGERDSQVILSMTEGVVAGWIHSRYGDYQVRPLPGGDYSVARVDGDRLTGCEPRIASVSADDADDDAGAGPRPKAPAIAEDGAGQIDVMVLFTPQARDEAGGAAAVRATIRLMVDIANEAFANSRMNARLNVVYTGPTPFEDAGVGIDDLELLLGTTRVTNLRDAHQADLVALIGSSDLLTGPDAVCGIAYLMTEPTGFAPFALSVTALPCLTTFAHEVGHNLGLDHDPANATVSPQEALFPWAYGHFVANNFRTVMAYANPCGNCERALHFSNPRVDYTGHPTGIENQRDNSRAGNASAPLVANFRLSGVIFQDDFEGSDLNGWPTVRSGLNLVEPGLGGSSQALEVTLTGSSARRFLAHRAPQPGTGIDVDFLLNLNQAQLGDTVLTLLEFFGQGQEHLSVTVRQLGGAYQMSLFARGDGNESRLIASTQVRATMTEKIGIRWRAATAPGEADGYVRLLKNDGPRGTVNDFDNGSRTVREVRIGVPQGSLGTGTASSFLIDDYRAAQPVE